MFLHLRYSVKFLLFYTSKSSICTFNVFSPHYKIHYLKRLAPTPKPEVEIWRKPHKRTVPLSLWSLVHN